MSKRKKFWTNTRIKQLAQMIEKSSRPTQQEAFTDAAAHFGVSRGAIMMAYRRKDGDVYYNPKKKSSKRSSKRGPYNTRKSDAGRMDISSLGKNPFTITDDTAFRGNRSGLISPLVLQLKAQVMALDPNDIRLSVAIPKTVAPTDKEATALVSALRRVLERSSDKVEKNTTVSIRMVRDSTNGNYLGARVFRITQR